MCSSISLWFWICVFLVTNDIMYLYKCLFITHISLVKFLFKYFAHLNIELFGFLLLSWKNFWYILYTILCEDYVLKYFLQSLTCLFVFLNISLKKQKFFILITSNSSFTCVCFSFCLLSKETLPNKVTKIFLLCVL